MVETFLIVLGIIFVTFSNWSFVIQGVIVCLFIYPHVGFMSEVKAGILSAETYPREAFSCCRVNQQRRRASRLVDHHVRSLSSFLKKDVVVPGG